MNRQAVQEVLALVVACALTVSAYAAGNGGEYTDVPEGAWYEEAVAYCKEQSLMDGTGGGLFSPDVPMSRAMAVTVLYRLAGSPEPDSDSGFSDVTETAWYSAPVAWAVETGVATGYDDSRFHPDQSVTREQLAAFLWRFYGSPEPADAGEEDFADRKAISPYALRATSWARERGLILGMPGNCFNPHGSATRAQMAVILLRYGLLETESTEILSESVMDVACAASGIAEMEDGSLLVTDIYNKVIWRVTEGVSKIYAGGLTEKDMYGKPVGGYKDAALSDSYFCCPWAIAPFAKGWAVSDAENGAVRILLPGGVQTINGQPQEKTAANNGDTAFDYPTGLAADDKGNLYVADTYRGIVYKITSAGIVSAVAEHLNDPMGLYWNNETLYVAETGANRVIKITRDGTITVIAGSGEDGYADGAVADAQFSYPKGVTVGEDGAVYVSDTGNSAIRKIHNGKVTTLLMRDRSSQNLALVSPLGLLIQEDTLYICDSFTRKLLTLSMGDTLP